MAAAANPCDWYLDSAAVAVALLADPAVTASWDEPSALAEFTVRGLAGHLARQVHVVRELLAAEEPEGDACRCSITTRVPSGSARASITRPTS
jgi:Mycothiol maleylpyruvate isomerase N-terminal domain